MRHQSHGFLCFVFLLFFIFSITESHNWKDTENNRISSRKFSGVKNLVVNSNYSESSSACDFEEENCLWENVRPPIEVKDAPVLRALSADVPTDMLKDDFDWVRKPGEEYFGPPRDHTLGTPQGFYVFLDPIFTSFGKTAVFMSERLRSQSGVCLKLWYAIPSYQNGPTLQVFVSSDFKKADQLLLIKEPTNADWKEGLVSVIPSPVMDSAFNDFWVFLLGKTGNNTMGYIAIDDISISEGICEELKCDCGHNSYACQRNEKGAKLCDCFPGYAQLEDLCSDCHCGENTVSCFFDRNGRNICICRDGFVQRNGTCTNKFEMTSLFVINLCLATVLLLLSTVIIIILLKM